MDDNVKLLDKYLSRYRGVLAAERQQEKLLQDLDNQMKNPIGSISYEPNLRPKNEISAGAAALPIRKDTIVHKINDIRMYALETLNDILEVLDLLDMSGEEREVLHYHYIEGLSWESIPQKASMSRARVYNRRRSGLNELLEFPEVQKLLHAYRLELDEREARKKGTPI